MPILTTKFLGICAFVFIYTNAGSIHSLFFATAPASGIENLYALPYFLGQILPTGILGLICAAMIAAFMSTHDSYLLCWSSVITQDIITPLRKQPLNNIQTLKLTRIIMILIGLYILYWGLFYQGNDDIWDYLAITGAVYFSGAFAVLTGGLYWKKASSTGAFLALITGFVSLLGLSPIKQWLGITSFSGAEIGLLQYF